MNPSTHDRLKHLLGLYYNGAISEAEAAELEAVLRDDRHSEAARQTLETLSAGVTPVMADQVAVNRMINRIKEAAGAGGQVKSLPGWLKVAAAALVLGAIATGAYLLMPKEVPQQAGHFGGDAAPGGNKATLTLADGSTISLDEAQRGTLSQQGGMQVVKTAEGELAYSGHGDNHGEPQYNTLTTPPGGQFRIQLPDGTSVWLNAGSSLRYPTAFTGHNRTVQLSGEGYFDIVKDASKPFVVQTATGLAVQVLGTEFNLQAYVNDAQITTTLLQGAVQVRQGAAFTVLAPGQQAVATTSGAINLVSNADTESAIAWKNGLFRFSDDDIISIMKQLSRWYNFEVTYQGEPVTEYFNATIPRDVPVSKVLELLEMTGSVHFTIKGNMVTVTR